MKPKSLLKLTIIFIVPILFSCNNNPIIVGENARFTIITPECIRLEFSPNGKFIDYPSLFAINRDARSNEFKFTDHEKNIIIETSRMRLEYKGNGLPFSLENLKIFVKQDTGLTKWVPGEKNKNNLGGTLRTVDGISGKVELGEGLLSRDGWYLLDDSKRPLLAKNWVKSRSENAGTDWYFFSYGKDYKSALKSLTTIGGKIPLPRKYVLGSWYSRYWPYSEEDYKQIVKEYKEYNFPIDVIVLDMDWHKDGWTGWSWNRKLLPDPEALLKWFHEQNLFVTINLHPADGVASHEDQYKIFMKKMGVNLNGIPDSTLPTLPFDVSNKKYITTFNQTVLTPLKNSGVDFWWLDWQQSEFTIGMPGLKNLEWLNRCFFNFTSTSRERGQSFSRWGGWGDHRYPIHFSGDAVAVWPMLAFEVPFTSTAGNIGCFFWSHDIGGHYGNFDQETNTRWVQFGALSAALRLHSTRDPNMDKRPWKFKSEYLKSMRIAFQLRSKLFPYIYSSAWKSVSESLPLTCPMYIQYPKKEISYNCPQQYFFGTSVLVAPIVMAGTGKNKVVFQNVWFPEGKWYNFFTNEKYEASEQPVSIWSDIYEFPVFAKGGVPIPMQPFRQRMTTSIIDTLVIRTYPGTDNQTDCFTLYEDDGISPEYTKGKYATTILSYSRKANTYEVKIEGTKGNYKGQIKKRSYIIQFPCTQKAVDAFVNGNKVQVGYDSVKSTNYINISTLPIGKNIIVSLTAQEINYEIIKNINYERRKSGLIDSVLQKKSALEIISSYSKKENINDFFNVFGFLTGISIHFNEDELSLINNSNGKAEKLSLKVNDSNGSENKDIVSTEIEKNSPVLTTYNFEMNPLGFGLKTVRTIQLKSVIDGRNIEFSNRLKEILPSIPSWLLVGPFDFDITKNIAECINRPEIESDLDTSKTYAGKYGQLIKWQTTNARKDGIVDIFNICKTLNSVAYATTYIYSANDQKIKFKIVSDDGNEVFLNNKKIFSNNVFRAINGPEDIAEGKLKKGVNKLMMKISQKGGGWEFRVKIDTEKAVKISTNPDAF